MVLYTIGIYIFGIFIHFASFFNLKAKLWVDGRKNIFKAIEAAKINTHKNVIWIHCASLGEFEQARPVIEEIKNKQLDYKILLTFFSPSGYEIRKNYSLADWVFYLSLDTKLNAQTFLKLTTPCVAIFVKYEFWFRHIFELKKNNILTYSLSAIFRKNQYYFTWKKYVLPNPLKLFTKIFVQDIASQHLLKSINIDSVVIGDTRFDRVTSIAANKKTLPEIEQFKASAFLLVIGSAWIEDIEVFSKLNFAKFPNLKIIIAPHNIDDETIKTISEIMALPVSKYSESNFTKANILIIDNIGMLSSIYQYADLAYIGGAFGKGLHNILEAATYGIPVIFGKEYQKFNEAKDLIDLKGAFSIQSSNELENIIDLFYKTETARNIAGGICIQYIEENKGATSRFLDKIKLG